MTRVLVEPGHAMKVDIKTTPLPTRPLADDSLYILKPNAQLKNTFE